MKDAIRSLAIVIFGWYILYAGYIWLDNFMSKDPLPVNRRAYAIVAVAAIITLFLCWSIVRDHSKQGHQDQNAFWSDISQSSKEGKI